MIDEVDTPDPLDFPNLLRFREPLTLARFRFALTTDPSTEKDQPILRDFMETVAHLPSDCDQSSCMRSDGVAYGRPRSCASPADSTTICA